MDRTPPPRIAVLRFLSNQSASSSSPSASASTSSASPQADIRFAVQYILFGVYDVLDVVQYIRLAFASVRFGVYVVC